MAAPYKHTIGNGVAGVFLIAAILLDLLKLLLFFIQGGLLFIPIVGETIGPALDIIGSIVIGFIEDIFIMGGLGLFGAFKGKNFTSSVLATLGTVVINAVPEVDATPSTTIAVIVIIVRTRAEDKIAHHKAIAAAKKAVHAQQDYQIRLQAAQEAAARAESMRGQALEASRRAANDNQPSAENENTLAAANDDEPEEELQQAA